MTGSPDWDHAWWGDIDFHHPNLRVAWHGPVQLSSSLNDVRLGRMGWRLLAEGPTYMIGINDADSRFVRFLIMQTTKPT